MDGSKVKQMKKRIVFSISLALTVLGNGFAQKSIVKLQVGYGFPLSSMLITENVQASASSTNYKGVYGSYGSGFQVEAGYIRPLNKNLSIEMDFSYLIGKTYNSSNNTGNNLQNQSTSSHFYGISPLLRVSFGGTKIRPYGAVGPVVGFGNLLVDYAFTNGSSVSGNEIQHRYSGSQAIGAKTAIGAEFTEGRFVFYAQLTATAISYAPSKSEYTKYTLNGVDQLAMLTTSQKQIVYKSSITSTGAQDPNQPTEQIKFFIPFSSISLSAGVMFKF
jgi:hypothetical protein